MKTIPSSVAPFMGQRRSLPHWVQVPVQKSPVYKLYGKYYHTHIYPVVYRRPSGGDLDFFRDVNGRPQTLWMNLADDTNISSSMYPIEFPHIHECFERHTESFSVEKNAIDVFRNLLMFELHGLNPQRSTVYIENPEVVGNIIKMTTEYPHGVTFSEKQFQLPFQGRSVFYEICMDTIQSSIVHYSLTPIDKDKTIVHLDIHMDKGKIPCILSRLQNRIHSTVRLKDTFSDTYSTVMKKYFPDVIRSITLQ